MPKQPRRIPNHDEECQLAVRIPGWFKNQIVDLCEREGVPVSVWVVAQLQRGVLEGRGVPEPPPARVGLPTVVDEIRAYVLGERVLLPCGRVGSCAGLVPEVVGGVGFCGECGIRVS